MPVKTSEIVVNSVLATGSASVLVPSTQFWDNPLWQGFGEVTAMAVLVVTLINATIHLSKFIKDRKE